jgi:hypothetical protein
MLHIMQFVEKPYSFWELTSSGLTEVWPWVPFNQNRLGDYYYENNFGLIETDWEFDDPQITLELRNVANELVMQNSIRLSELQPERGSLRWQQHRTGHRPTARPPGHQLEPDPVQPRRGGRSGPGRWSQRRRGATHHKNAPTH